MSRSSSLHHAMMRMTLPFSGKLLHPPRMSSGTFPVFPFGPGPGCVRHSKSYFAFGACDHLPSSSMAISRARGAICGVVVTDAGTVVGARPCPTCPASAHTSRMTRIGDPSPSPSCLLGAARVSESQSSPLVVVTLAVEEGVPALGFRSLFPGPGPGRGPDPWSTPSTGVDIPADARTSPPRGPQSSSGPGLDVSRRLPSASDRSPIATWIPWATPAPWSPQAGLLGQSGLPRPGSPLPPHHPRQGNPTGPPRGSPPSGTQVPPRPGSPLPARMRRGSPPLAPGRSPSPSPYSKGGVASS